MSYYELLNNDKHRDLKILTKRSKDLGDGVGGCVVYPTEFNELQKYYPILFQPQDDGGWLLITIFGFENDENLFLDEPSWRVPYVPAVIEREPFLIGLKQSSSMDEPEAIIQVDLESPRISQNGDGEAVFLEYGGNSPFLERIIAVLTTIHEGVAEAERMIKVFTELDLIEPITLEIEFDNSPGYSVSRFATVSKEKLLALSDEQLGKLHRSGLLRYAYMIVGSLTNVQTLVNYKNRQLRSQ